ncbi:deoxyuridine 5'-triphosphate nucleotidohydrolase [Peptostreptococcus sp. D1]|uniref:deoxyuridine 5'-triphosphate nucleotidohydrolase n=1 Tax=Peptostreptococcus sp. D1 TaxID=72304 RepID=UPI0008EF5D3F|nr:deoxyuridine 5'-triphosphate nucleotidohydrolase [Peptostreptococcus sp. D1]SFE27454.1 dUTP pyrophosphatase [Peptostreptococcus sp. D1]
MVRGFELVDDKFRKHPDLEINLPVRGTSKSAGYDIVTPVDIVIPPRGNSGVIFTDIKSYMLEDEVLTTHVRSSIGMKRGLVLANTTGIIDSDYYSNPDNDGNIGFMLRNLTDKEVVIKAGERVIQGIFIKYLTADDDMPASDMRLGGVGSTGRK